jgi:hypothetical protein
MKDQAKEVRGIVIIAHHVLKGESILETTCRDYDHYKSLPELVAYQGQHFGKTGWSSDTYMACYKSSAAIAYKVR